MAIAHQLRSRPLKPRTLKAVGVQLDEVEAILKTGAARKIMSQQRLAMGFHRETMGFHRETMGFYRETIAPGAR